MARVKVYQLNGEGQWDDKGTGNVHHNVANDGCVGYLRARAFVCEEI
jgi:hypothetical protein